MTAQQMRDLQRLKDLAGGCSPNQEITLNAKDAFILGLDAPDGSATVTGKQLNELLANDGQHAEVAEGSEEAPVEGSTGNKKKPAKKTAAKKAEDPPAE